MVSICDLELKLLMGGGGVIVHSGWRAIWEGGQLSIPAGGGGWGRGSCPVSSCAIFAVCLSLCPIVACHCCLYVFGMAFKPLMLF